MSDFDPKRTFCPAQQSSTLELWLLENRLQRLLEKLRYSERQRQRRIMLAVLNRVYRLPRHREALT